MTRLPALSHQDHRVAWICALSIELTAAKVMLDEVHPSLSQDSQDNNTYTLGRIGKHNVVMACLPAGQTGNNFAAAAASQMQYSFKAIRFGLMVGIGGGVPSGEHDIRLWDVVVSNSGKIYSGVIRYDFGRTIAEGRFGHNSSLNAPPTLLLTAISHLKATHNLHGDQLAYYLLAVDTPELGLKYTCQGAENEMKVADGRYGRIRSATSRPGRIFRMRAIL